MCIDNAPGNGRHRRNLQEFNGIPEKLVEKIPATVADEILSQAGLYDVIYQIT